ncbi:MULTISPECIES: ABC transporter family substrate-binding protein [Rhodococcus]|uniref:ABC transporter family substrate-binding protein n=1 Tax=Rhodococcus TaxID=1827 RepID=UPI000A5AB78F|nr:MULTISPECIES: ABC transporter family substrate-binding protein [Rhodococcus]QXW02092.1 ABC transporter family substrate-binding protein [Rhodococcus globerulus]ROZ43758.1 ABC transporter family substrate-binding protein [Rhodococcus sp. WS3]
MVAGRRYLALAVAVTALSLTACTADPPPPVESTETVKPTTTPVTPAMRVVSVAIDQVGDGFNPHLLADLSPVNSAVGNLVLPSVFRPISSPVQPGQAEWVLDDSLAVSAEVVSEAPFTIRYQLRNEAQWSDGAPIAAEDFRYLWQQMISVPGVVNPAGYQLISDVTSSGGGKTVNVVMRAAYPAWRELFTDLLPSHLVKDTPGGFSTGLSEGIPVSGAHFHVRSVDRGRDEIILERNDRFWGEPSDPDQIVMRRAGSAAQLAEAMRTDDSQIAQIHAGSATDIQLSAVPGVSTAFTFVPRTLDMTINGRSATFADVRVRKAVLGLLDSDLLAVVAAGSESAAVPAKAQILSPSDPGYVPTAPPKQSRERSMEQLVESGYVVVPPAGPVVVGGTNGSVVRDGKPLELTLGAPENDDIAIAVANTAADELRDAGIAATVKSLPAEELYGTELTTGSVDMVVGWIRAGVDPATSLASRFSCPLTPTVPVTTTETPESTSTAPTPTTARESDSEAPSNISGLCDPSLQPRIDEALSGIGDFGALIADAEPKLWDLAAVLPIVQDRTLAALGTGVEGVTLTSPVQVGIFGDATNWVRVKE